MSEPDPAKVRLSQATPNNFCAFVAGRLSGGDDRIKQGMLAVRAFGSAVKAVFSSNAGKANRIRQSPKLRMRGVLPADHDQVRVQLKEASNREIECDLAEFTIDRSRYFQDLATSSVAMMPSWHEGFGLTGWEAIACMVPVILGEQSGVYRLLADRKLGVGPGTSVRSLPVQGRRSNGTDGHNHSEDDVEVLSEELVNLGAAMPLHKSIAVRLARQLLLLDYTWSGCAKAALHAMGRHLQVDLGKNPRDKTALVEDAEASGSADDDLPDFFRAPRPRAWRKALGLAPSAMLAARDRLTRFSAEREPLIGNWLQWLEEAPTSLSMQLVVGRGGSGKTRSALELHSRALVAGHRCLWLHAKLPHDWPERLAQALRSSAAKTILIVVDYAEGRQDELVTALQTAVSVMREGAAEVRIRFLLFARSAPWLGALPRREGCSAEVAELLEGPANLGSEELPALDRDSRRREVFYRSVLQDYAAESGLPRPRFAYLPRLDDPAFDLPVYMHLAAVAALDGDRPAHPASLVTTQLRREWQYRQRAGSSVDVTYDDWADALAWIGLQRQASVADAGAAFAGFGIDPKLALEFAQTYADGRGGIADLTPDVLLDTLLVERLNEARASALLSAVLGRDAIDLAPSLVVLGRAITRLSNMVGVAAPPEAELPRWHRELVDALALAWPTHPQLLIDAALSQEYSGSVLFAKLLGEAWKNLDKRMRQAIAGAVRLHPEAAPMLALTIDLLTVRLDMVRGDVAKSEALLELSAALAADADPSRQKQALKRARECLSLCRHIEKKRGSGGASALASAMVNLAQRLSQQNTRAAGEEAQALYLQALSTFPRSGPAFRGGDIRSVAVALHAMAQHLLQSGTPGSATRAAELAAQGASAFEALSSAAVPDSEAWRDAQHGLASCQLTVAWAREREHSADAYLSAVSSGRQAVQRMRKLAQEEPALYRQSFAGSLVNLARCLSESGDEAQTEEGVRYIREAVGIWRDLAFQQPRLHRNSLAVALHNLSMQLAERGAPGDADEALATARECLEIRRSLALEDPAGQMPALSNALRNYSRRLAQVGIGSGVREEALHCAREELALWRAMAMDGRANEVRELAVSLNNLAVRLADLGVAEAMTEAADCLREALSLLRPLARGDANARDKLAEALNDLAVVLSTSSPGDASEVAEALAFAEEAVDIRRSQAREHPDRFGKMLAEELSHLACFYLRSPLPSAATKSVDMARDAVAEARKLFKRWPLPHRLTLAKSLNNLAQCLAARAQGNDALEAVDAAREAADLAVDPEAGDPFVRAMAQDTLCSLLASGSRPEAQVEAATMIRVRIGELRHPSLAAEEALTRLLNMLSLLARLVGEHAELAESGEMRRIALEATEVSRRLQTVDASFGLQLGCWLSNLGNQIVNEGDPAEFDEAVECWREALDALKRVAAGNSVARGNDLLQIGMNVTYQLLVTGEPTWQNEALAVSQGIVDHFRAQGVWAADATAVEKALELHENVARVVNGLALDSWQTPPNEEGCGR